MEPSEKLAAMLLLLLTTDDATNTQLSAH